MPFDPRARWSLSIKFGSRRGIVWDHFCDATNQGCGLQGHELKGTNTLLQHHTNRP